MTEEEFEKEKQIWQWLQGLPVGTVKTISKSPNPELFLKIAKTYADLTGMVEFNTDFTKLKRIPAWWESLDGAELSKRIYENFTNTSKPGTGETK